MATTYQAQMFMRGAWVDVTPRLRHATWRYGSTAGNSFGRVYAPAVGVLTLENQDGDYTPYKPAAYVDPAPRVPVKIDVDGVRVFTGWSDGMLGQVPLTQDYLTTVPLLGALGYISEYHDQLFTALRGDQLTGAAIGNILDAVGWPTGSDYRLIYPGLTELHAIRVNQVGILGGANRQRVPFLDAVKVICQAEVGRCYDDRLGRVVFESRVQRSGFQGRTPFVVDEGAGAKIRQLTTGSIQGQHHQRHLGKGERVRYPWYR